MNMSRTGGIPTSWAFGLPTFIQPSNVDSLRIKADIQIARTICSSIQEGFHSESRCIFLRECRDFLLIEPFLALQIGTQLECVDSEGKPDGIRQTAIPFIFSTKVL